jgi:hypothetical protein
VLIFVLTHRLGKDGRNERRLERSNAKNKKINNRGMHKEQKKKRKIEAERRNKRTSK